MANTSQVDQAWCETCGMLGSEDSYGGFARYRQNLAKLRKHAREKKHAVHVYTSASVHFYYTEEEDEVA